jgi:hypothetical protein
MQHCSAVLLVNGGSVLADDGRCWLAFASAPRINSGLVKRLHCVDCLALSCSSSDVPGPLQRRRSYNCGTGDFIVQPLATTETMR